MSKKLLPKCVKCGETDTSKISKCSRFKNGYRSRCKACDKAHYEATKESRLKKCKEYRETKLDKTKMSEYSKQYRHLNAEHIRASKLAYCKNNRDSFIRRAAKRKAMKLSQTPPMSAKELLQIAMLYKISNIITYTLGIVMHVDHIIPLSQGGLHHPLNLQVIPSTENLSKGAIIPDNLTQELKDLHNNFYGEIKYE